MAFNIHYSLTDGRVMYYQDGSDLTIADAMENCGLISYPYIPNGFFNGSYPTMKVDINTKQLVPLIAPL